MISLPKSQARRDAERKEFINSLHRRVAHLTETLPERNKNSIYGPPFVVLNSIENIPLTEEEKLFLGVVDSSLVGKEARLQAEVEGKISALSVVVDDTRVRQILFEERVITLFEKRLGPGKWRKTKHRNEDGLLRFEKMVRVAREICFAPSIVTGQSPVDTQLARADS